MSEKVCKFRGCGKPIKDWETYCKVHEKYMNDLQEGLDILDVHFHSEE